VSNLLTARADELSGLKNGQRKHFSYAQCRHRHVNPAYKWCFRDELSYSRVNGARYQVNKVDPVLQRWTTHLENTRTSTRCPDCRKCRFTGIFDRDCQPPLIATNQHYGFKEQWLQWQRNKYLACSSLRRRGPLFLPL
jgi:hypothetical protein